MLALVKLEKALNQAASENAGTKHVKVLLEYLIARQFVQRGGYDDGILMMLDLSQNAKGLLAPAFTMRCSRAWQRLICVVVISLWGEVATSICWIQRRMRPGESCMKTKSNARLAPRLICRTAAW